MECGKDGDDDDNTTTTIYHHHHHHNNNNRDEGIYCEPFPRHRVKQPNSSDPVAYLAELGVGMLLPLGPVQAPPSPPLLLASGNRNSKLDSPTIAYLALNASFSPLSLWPQ